MTSYLVLLIILLVVSAVSWGVNYLQRSGKSEPLADVVDTRLCNLHKWNEVTFLENEDFYEDYRQNPGKYPTDKYCTVCGLVPRMNKMVKPDYLLKLAKIEADRAREEQNIKDFNELQRVWLDCYFEDRTQLSPESKALIECGYELHGKFVDNLPELMRAKEISRILEDLTPQK